MYKPPTQRGMQELDRSKFNVTVPLLAARVPLKEVSAYRQSLQPALLKAKKACIVQDSQSQDTRLLVLDTAEQQQLPSEILSLIQERHLELTPYTLELDYDYWSASDILQSVLPEELLEDAPTSFSLAGHIAHYNIRDEFLPYRFLIGQVTMDKNPAVRTVVNKLDSIDNEFRFFKMEVLAGEPDYQVTLSESGCKFTFDFSKVFWNSRLQMEHLKLVESFKPEDVVVDAFAGVGPFAVPAAKKGCAVFASDLNPESAKSLTENARVNKVTDNCRTDNMDARDHIKKSVVDAWRNPFPAYQVRPSAKQLARQIRHGQKPVEIPAGPPRRLVDHFVMNLPALAITFLDAFRGVYNPLKEEDGFMEAIEAKEMPLIHCYCFSNQEDYVSDLCAHASESMGFRVTPELPGFEISLVRSVSRNKDMYRLDFRVPREVAFAAN